MNDTTTNISKIKNDKIVSELSFMNLVKENKKKQEMTYEEYLQNYISKYKSLLPVINEKIEFQEVKSSELTMEIQNLIK